MTFDFIVGNPPYQDTSTTGANKKLWKDITRKVQGLARQIIFLTPAAQVQYLKPWHTFYLDYTVQKYFPDIGTKIVGWGMQYEPCVLKTYSSDGTIDSEFYDAPFRNIREEFENLKKTPQQKKLFKRQGCGSGNLVVIKNASTGETDVCEEYVIPDGHKILAISTSKSLKRENVLIGYEHYGSLYAQIDINDWTDEQIEAFISDLLDPDFVEYCNQFRLYYGTGFNNVLLYTDSLEKKVITL